MARSAAGIAASARRNGSRSSGASRQTSSDSGRRLSAGDPPALQQIIQPRLGGHRPSPGPQDDRRWVSRAAHPSPSGPFYDGPDRSSLREYPRPRPRLKSVAAGESSRRIPALWHPPVRSAIWYRLAVARSGVTMRPGHDRTQSRWLDNAVPVTRRMPASVRPPDAPRPLRGRRVRAAPATATAPVHDVANRSRTRGRPCPLPPVSRLPLAMTLALLITAPRPARRRRQLR